MQQYKSRFTEAQKFEGLSTSEATKVNANIQKSVNLLSEAALILEGSENPIDKKLRKMLLNMVGQLKQSKV